MAREHPSSRNALRRRHFRPADSCTHLSVKSSSNCRRVPIGATTRSCAKRSSASNGWRSMREASRPPSQSGSIPGFGRSLGARLRSNEKALLAAYRSIARAVDEGRGITPAAEWVLDNYHVVEEQIREIREDLPPRVLQTAAQAHRGTVRGFSARVRHRVGIRRPHRQPFRTRNAAPIRARLSEASNR